MIKKKIIYILFSILYAWGFFWLSMVVYSNIAGRNVLLASILNLVLIFIFVIMNKLEDLFLRKILTREKCKELNLPLKALKQYFLGPSFKSSLYIFYIVILVGVAILAADPYIGFLQEFRGYLLSVQYGVLFLIAVDKFLAHILKDITRDDKLIAQKTEKENAEGADADSAKEITKEIENYEEEFNEDLY